MAQVGSDPDVKSLTASETKLFEAFRVWSLGVSHDASKIAFACADGDNSLVTMHEDAIADLPLLTAA